MSTRMRTAENWYYSLLLLLLIPMLNLQIHIYHAGVTVVRQKFSLTPNVDSYAFLLEQLSAKVSDESDP